MIIPLNVLIQNIYEATMYSTIKVLYNFSIQT